MGLDKRKGAQARVRHSIGIYQDTTNKKNDMKLQNHDETEQNESILSDIAEDFSEKIAM